MNLEQTPEQNLYVDGMLFCRSQLANIVYASADRNRRRCRYEESIYCGAGVISHK